jgi:mycothiol system anti-sigma-R factor
MSEPMLSCSEAVEQMWAYIDGELADVEGEAVREHLAACRRCYPHYDFQKAFCQFLRGHRGAGAPPELRRRLFLRLLAEERAEAE